MYRYTWIIPAVCALSLFGCAMQAPPPPAEESKPSPEAEKNIPAPPVAKPDIQVVKSADGLIRGMIIGKIKPDSKFAKLQIGMTLEQVERLIGSANAKDTRVTGKQFKPFYFGGDTQRTESFYANEGQLTFSNIHQDEVPDTLIRIVVNPDATGIFDVK